MNPFKIKGCRRRKCFESTSVYNIIILSRTRMRKGMKNTQGSTFACFTLLWMILTIKDVFRIFNFSFVFIIDTLNRVFKRVM